MTEAAAARASSAVRRVIDEAWLVPPPLEAADDFEAPAAQRRYRPLPIKVLGIAEASAGETVVRYGVGEALVVFIDTRGCRRFQRPEQLDRDGVASLFLFGETALPAMAGPERTRPLGS